MSKDAAQIIVEGILAAVERCGRFEGRGKNRTLALSLVVTREGGEQTAYSKMVEWTREQLALASPPAPPACQHLYVVETNTCVHCGDTRPPAPEAT